MLHHLYFNKLLAQESAQPLKLSKNTSTAYFVRLQNLDSRILDFLHIEYVSTTYLC